VLLDGVRVAVEVVSEADWYCEAPPCGMKDGDERRRRPAGSAQVQLPQRECAGTTTATGATGATASFNPTTAEPATATTATNGITNQRVKDVLVEFA
jgi:hypothetical protein